MTQESVPRLLLRYFCIIASFVSLLFVLEAERVFSLVIILSHSRDLELKPFSQVEMAF